MAGSARRRSGVCKAQQCAPRWSLYAADKHTDLLLQRLIATQTQKKVKKIKKTKPEPNHGRAQGRTRGEPGANPRRTRGEPGANPGRTRGEPGANPYSPFKPKPGPCEPGRTWGEPGANPRRTRGEPGANPGEPGRTPANPGRTPGEPRRTFSGKTPAGTGFMLKFKFREASFLLTFEQSQAKRPPPLCCLLLACCSVFV